MSKSSLPYRNVFFRFLNLLVICCPVKSKFYSNLILMNYDLKFTGGCKTTSVCDVMIASESDIHSIENHPEKKQISFIYKGRLEKGHTCYVAKKGQELLGYIWINPESFSHFYGSKDAFLFRPLTKNERFTYDWYVFEAHRNRGILKSLVHFMFDDLKMKGVDTIFSTSEMKNTASIRAHLTSGFSPAGLIHLYRVESMRHVFGGTQGEARALGRWISSFQESCGIRPVSVN